MIQALMEMDCIPSGMELFPAADEEQWQFIKRIIDDCDYYVLIIGGRYGSTTAEGISYTEKEYDYAIEKGIKVVAFLHANPDEIPLGKSEGDPEARGRLKAFREKVANNRLVKFWKTAEELPGLVSLSLSKTIKTYPAVGWIRADQVSNTQLLNELNELRKKNENLNSELIQLREAQSFAIPDLASIEENIGVIGQYGEYDHFNKKTRYHGWEVTVTWKQLFALIAPYILNYPNDDAVKKQLAHDLYKQSGGGDRSASLDDQVYQTIKIQLQALNLVNVQYLKTTGGGMSLFWSLTRSGHALMMALRTVKTASS